MRLVFLGAPGAGKGTQAALLQERLHTVHLSSGDLLRDAAHQGDSLAREIHRFMQAGELVPDPLVTSLILKHVEGLGESRSFVLDGFPRTVEQAVTLDEDLEKKGHQPIDLAIDFEVSQEVVVRRLTGRRVCPQCGANYHTERMPPMKEGVCDRCGVELEVREDDQPQTILKRLVVYREQTASLLDFYRGQGKLKPLAGDLNVEEQYRALVELLKQERLLDRLR